MNTEEDVQRVEELLQDRPHRTLKVAGLNEVLLRHRENEILRVLLKKDAPRVHYRPSDKVGKRLSAISAVRRAVTNE